MTKTKYQFCTLFDKNYLLKGLALYNSLLKHCDDFNLWILCMDNDAFDILEKLNLSNVRLIKLSEIETAYPRLLSVKKDRGAGEYCWTTTPFLPLFILEKDPQIEIITYLDADLYFFSSPLPVFRELGKQSVMIIPHRYHKHNQHMEKTSGIFNVGMVSFRNDSDGLECLNWQKERCLEWCYAQYEDGKLGDQLYLNKWPEKFKNVCILKNIGAGAASWNIYQYKVKKTNQEILINETPLIFYHFHNLVIYQKKGVIKALLICIYGKTIYQEYLNGLTKAYQEILSKIPSFSYGLRPEPLFIKLLKQAIQNKLRYFNIKLKLWLKK